MSIMQDYEKLRKKLGDKKYEAIDEYIKIYGNYFLLILLSLIILNIIIKFFRKKVINNWLEWLMYAGTVSIVTVIVLFLIFLLNKDFRNVIKIYLLKYKSL